VALNLPLHLHHMACRCQGAWMPRVKQFKTQDVNST
jgi:hypothetical protein